MSEIQFPITVTGVDFSDGPPIMPPLFGGKTGDFVSIRPVGKEHEGKTYLGILIGDVAQGAGLWFDRNTGRVRLGASRYNPGILVPSLGKVIYGAESWWGVIETPEQLREITDQDIDSVWYVQALKALAKEKADAGE